MLNHNFGQHDRNIGAPYFLVNRHTLDNLADHQIMDTLRSRFVKARTESGLKQVQLAKKAEVTQASISDLERGESLAMKGTTLVKVCAALRVRPEWLLFGKGPMRDENALADSERALLDQYRQMAPTHRIAIRQLMAAPPETIEEVAAKLLDLKDAPSPERKAFA